ncbi:MAG: hypothetical protein AAGA90_16015 [Actinomycetota bacterium]
MTGGQRPTGLGPRILGSVGVVLLLAAALSVVSARWELFGPGARLAALLAASGLLVGLTRWVRHRAPSTARLLDVLAAAMVSIDVAATVVVAGGSWRTALVVAGPTTVVVGSSLRARVHPVVGDLTVGLGGTLTVAGLSAALGGHAPLGLALLAAATAGVSSRPGDRRIAAGWAAIAGLAPAARVLDDVVFTGMGTLREIGLVDPASLTVTATTGAAAVLASLLVAVRDRAPSFAVVALGVGSATVLEGWAIADPPRHVALLAAAVVLALVELIDVRRLPLSPAMIGDLERLNEAALIGVTAVVAGGSWMRLTGEAGGIADTPITAGVLAAAWVLGQARRGAQPWPPALPGLVVAAAVAVHLGTGDVGLFGAALVIGGWLAILVNRRESTAVALVASAVAPVVAIGAGEPWIVAVLAIAAAGTVVTLVRWRSFANDSVVGAGLLVVLVHGVLVVGAGSLAWGSSVAVVLVAVLWSGTGLVWRSVQAASAMVLRALALMAPLLLLTTAPLVAAGAAVCLAVVAAIDLVVAQRDGIREQPITDRVALLASSLVVGWVSVLYALHIELVDAYVVPVLWCAVVAAVLAGAPRAHANLLGLGATGLVAVVGRIADGDPVHTAVLGAVAVLVAVFAARADDSSTLLVAAPVAVAVATFDLLDRSVGVESWGWLLVGGAAALCGAVVLEGRDADSAPGSSVV